MIPFSLGLISVPTPGTAIPLAIVTTRCTRIRVQAPAGVTGKTYFGYLGVNGSALSGVIAELAPNPSDGVDAEYEISTGTDTNVLDLALYAIDAAEGLIVSYWVV